MLYHLQSGITPLHEAARVGHTTIAEALIIANAPLDVQDSVSASLARCEMTLTKIY